MVLHPPYNYTGLTYPKWHMITTGYPGINRY